MSNVAALVTSFKKEILAGVHALGTDALKAALYLTTGTLGAATTAYSATAEVSGAGYTAGGIAANDTVAPDATGTTGFWTPGADFVFGPNLTLATAFDGVLLYNVDKANKAICVNNFGAQIVTNGTFTLHMPANDAVNALVRIE